MVPQLFVSIVTFNHAEVLAACLGSLKGQRGVVLGKDFVVQVVDNKSSDDSVAVAAQFLEPESIVQLHKNIGFCGAHNIAASQMMRAEIPYLLVLNPDTEAPAFMIADLLAEIAKARDADPSIGGAGCLLLRKTLPGEPLVIDSAGIDFSTTIRHFDAGAGMPFAGKDFAPISYVAGVTGACLLLCKDFIRDVSFRSAYDDDVLSVYPQLGELPPERIQPERIQLFDEAFFAYREDAELAWRGGILGWKFVVFPQINCTHIRRVTPERRGLLSTQINALSVKNRFLLQISCFSWLDDYRAIIPGILFRNIVVIIGVLLRERSSCAALVDVLRLARRGWYRRKYLMQRRKGSWSILAIK